MGRPRGWTRERAREGAADTYYARDGSRWELRHGIVGPWEVWRDDILVRTFQFGQDARHFIEGRYEPAIGRIVRNRFGDEGTIQGRRQDERGREKWLIQWTRGGTRRWYVTSSVRPLLVP